MQQAHTPVLLTQCLQVLAPTLGDAVLDVTAGLGGHAAAFAERVGDSGFVTVLDADAQNLARAYKRVASIAPTEAIHANFAALPECLPQERRAFAVVFADLGLSSPHLDTQGRGFSFHDHLSPLDMRFNSAAGSTAADLLHEATEQKLATVFRAYGELPSASRLAHTIAKRRAAHPIRTVLDLTTLAEEVYGYRAKPLLPQLFQALRIAVNGELEALENLLSLVPVLLAPRGRIGILTYHSLEDRLVKRAFKALCTAEKHPMTGMQTVAAPFVDICKGGCTPDQQEIAANPRSRSARLRAIQRTS